MKSREHKIEKEIRRFLVRSWKISLNFLLKISVKNSEKRSIS
jgi:hypothetical protein